MQTTGKTNKADASAALSSTIAPVVSNEDSSPMKTPEVAVCRAQIVFFHELRVLLRDERLRSAIYWQPRHQAMVINPEMFERLILSRSAASPKFTSFQRRLNRWGFRRDRNLVLYGNLLVYKNTDFQFKKKIERRAEARERNPFLGDQQGNQIETCRTCGTMNTNAAIESSLRVAQQVELLNILEDSRLSAELLSRRVSSERVDLLQEQPRSVIESRLLQQEIDLLRRQQLLDATSSVASLAEIRRQNYLIDSSVLQPGLLSGYLSLDETSSDSLVLDRLAIARRTDVLEATSGIVSDYLPVDSLFMQNLVSSREASVRSQSSRLDSIVRRMNMLQDEDRQELWRRRLRNEDCV